VPVVVEQQEYDDTTVCTICNKHFRTNAQCSRHMQREHGTVMKQVDDVEDIDDISMQQDDDGRYKCTIGCNGV
jgi:hypothetical protein